MRPLTVALLVVLAATLFAAWLFSTHERVTVTEWQGYQGEARFNEFFAAEQLLREAGLASEGLATWAGNEHRVGQYDTLVTRLGPQLTGRHEELLQWLAAGGHLVLLPPFHESAVTGEFLASFGFELVPADAGAGAAEPGQEAEDEPSDYDYLVNLDLAERRVEVQWAIPVTATLSDELGNIAARRTWGSGYVTVFAVAPWFSNLHLEQEDHARLLLDAVAGYIEPGAVWFVYDASVPALWQLVWRAFPLLVICAALALLTWIAAIVPSFGPAIRPEPVSRRSILEHVRAAGLFTWRHRGAAALSAATIDATLRAAEARHPGLARLAADDQARRLAQLTGLPAQRIHGVLAATGATSQRDFTADIHLLKEVRNHL